MKKLNVILLAIISFSLFFSCGKYEEGPSFTLRTKTARLTGEWEMKERANVMHTIKDEDMTEEIEALLLLIESADSNIEMEILRGGEGTITKDDLEIEEIDLIDFTVEYDMEWKFSDDKTELLLRYRLGSSPWSDWRNYTILRLTNSELWLHDIDSYKDYDIIIEKKFEKK